MEELTNEEFIARYFKRKECKDARESTTATRNDSADMEGESSAEYQANETFNHLEPCEDAELGKRFVECYNEEIDRESL